MRYILSSSDRLQTVSFANVAAAIKFLDAKKPSQETVCLVDTLTEETVFYKSYP